MQTWSLSRLSEFPHFEFSEQTSDPKLSLTFKQQQLKEDLQKLKSELESSHSGLYRYTSKAAIDSAFKKTLAEIPNNLTMTEFYGRVLKLVALINCGHTRLQMPDDFQTEYFNQTIFFPLLLKWIEGKAYVVQDLNDNNKINDSNFTWKKLYIMCSNYLPKDAKLDCPVTDIVNYECTPLHITSEFYFCSRCGNCFSAVWC